MSDKINKSEVVRVELENKDFFTFSELNSRIVFSNKELNLRKEKEEAFKFALRTTLHLIRKSLDNEKDGLFINDDEITLINKFEDKIREPLLNKQSEYNKAIEFAIALGGTDGIDFISLWKKGENDLIREKYPTCGWI